MQDHEHASIFIKLGEESLIFVDTLVSIGPWKWMNLMAKANDSHIKKYSGIIHWEGHL